MGKRRSARGLLVCALILSFHALASAQTGPFCSSGVTQNCIVSVTTTNPTTPATVSANLQFNATTGTYSLAVVNTGGSDVFELSPALTTASVVTVIFKGSSDSAAVDPKLAVSTGLIASWSINTSVTPHEITLVASPRASSWARGIPGGDDEPPGGCTPSFCEQTADVDYQAFLLAAFDPMAPPPSPPPGFTTFTAKFAGGFISTNAQYFSPIPSYDQTTKAISFFLGAPHFKFNGSAVLNTGFVRVFIPEAVVVDLWQVSGGSASLDASATSVTVGGSTASFTIEPVKDSSDNPLGALVKVGETTAFGYSVPEVVVKPNSTNQAPTLAGPANQSTNEDTALSGLSITVGDDSTAAASLQLTASSSNQTLVPNSALVLGGAGTNRTLAITPAANQSGTATITLTVSDGSLSSTASFTLTVNAVNDAPSISDVTNKSTAEDSTLSAVAFTVADIETAASSLSITTASSNTTLVPNAAITLGGSGGDRTLSVTPAANQSGTTTITLTVSDGAATASDTFELTVTAVNDPPTISNIADQATAFNTAVSGISFSVSDVETNAAALTLSAASSNITLVPVSAIAFGGSDGNRTVSITPATGQSGTATITVTVSDGALTASDTFVLTVAAANQAPTISSLATQSGIAGRLVGPLAITVGDPDTALSSLTVTASSGNASVVAATGLVVGGSGANRTISVQTSSSVGTAVITITVSDGSLSTSTSFDVVSTHSAPQSLTALVNGAIVTLSWTAPAAGGEVSSYRLELGRGSGEATTTINAGAMTAIAANTLAAGVWFARVRAVSAAGDSPASNEVSFTLSATPMSPRNLSALVGVSAATFTWDPPLGGAVTGYRLEAGSATGLANLGSQDLGNVLTFSSPLPNGTYFVRVRTLNAAGQSAASNEVSFTVGAGLATPGAPQSPQASVSGSAVVISWAAPTSGGAPAGYLVEAGSATGLTNVGVIPTGGTTFSVPVAPPGTYFVRIRATNSAGPGPASNEVTFTVGSAPIVLPGAPVGLAAAVSGSTVNLTWSAPASGGAPSGYIVRVGSAPGLSDLATIALGVTTSTTASGVPSGTYYVRVVALNAAGVSVASNEAQVVVP